MPRLRFAGQVTGVEGYVESAATGLLAGRFAAAERIGCLRGDAAARPPATTAHGALLGHITGGAEADTFQPMNINFGLLPPLEEGMLADIRRKERKRERKKMMALRALADLDAWRGATAQAAE
jgi:methylenetetrahydrofolate--tRNA-(uracil-5-)-methyltransferase